VPFRVTFLEMPVLSALAARQQRDSAKGNQKWQRHWTGYSGTHASRDDAVDGRCSGWEVEEVARWPNVVCWPWTSVRRQGDAGAADRCRAQQQGLEKVENAKMAADRAGRWALGAFRMVEDSRSEESLSSGLVPKLQR
jgi:hypothetical protein